MSKSSHTVKVKKGSSTYSAPLFDTTDEAKGTSGYYLPVKVGNYKYYAPLFPATYSQTYLDTYGLPLHIYKGGTEYVLAKNSIFRIRITTVANQTITVKIYNKLDAIDGIDTPIETFTSGSRYYPYGYSFWATVASATGYTEGEITGNASAGVPYAGNFDDIFFDLYENRIADISATSVSLRTFTLKLAATTNQTITLKYKNRNAANTGYEAEITKTSTSSAQSFTVRYGTTWTASIAGAAGYNPGSLSASSGTVKAATTVSAGSASLKTFTLKLAATSHQTITLVYKNRNSANTGYESAITKKSTSSAQSFTVRYGTTWTASLAAAAGYNKGKLSASSGTVKAATTVSATAASVITYTIKFTWTNTDWTPTGTVTYTNSAGTSKTATKPASVVIKYGTKIKITDTKNNYYYYLDIYKGSTYLASIHQKGSWTSGALKANANYTIKGTVESSGSGGEGSGGEGGA